jgi:hypothetical protein
VLLLGLVAFLGYELGDAAHDPEPPSPSERSIRTGSFALRAPATWRRVAGPIRTPGLELRDGVQLLPPGGAGSSLTVGLLPGADGTVLPPYLARRAGFVLPDAAVRIGRLDALLYGDTRALGYVQSGMLFAGPVQRGTLIGMCKGRASSFIVSCEAAMATLRLSRQRSYPVRVSGPLAETLNATVGRLEADRSTGAVGMWRASDAGAQAAAARSIAQAYDAAAERLRAAEGGSRDAHTRLVLIGAFERAAGAWGRLAGAADRQGDVAYEQAGRTAIAADSAVRTTVALAAASSPRRVTAPPPSAPNPPAQAQGRPCSETHREWADVEDKFRSLVRVCRNSSATSLRVENISNLVIFVSFPGRRPEHDDLTPIPASPNIDLMPYVAKVSCEEGPCQLPPGATVKFDSDRPLRPAFDYALKQTGLALAARLGGSKLKSFLTPRPRRRAEQFVGCMTAAQEPFQAQYLEEVARHAVDLTEKCSVLKDVFGEKPEARKVFWRRNLVLAKELSGGIWYEGALMGGKGLLGLLRVR